jgi:hypothetical protein
MVVVTTPVSIPCFLFEEDDLEAIWEETEGERDRKEFVEMEIGFGMV